MCVTGSVSQRRKSEFVQLMSRLVGAEGRGWHKACVHDCRHRERAEEVHNLSLRGPLHSCAGNRGKCGATRQGCQSCREPSQNQETRSWECAYEEVDNTITLCHVGLCLSATVVGLLVDVQASRDLSCPLQLGGGVGVCWSRGVHQW